MVMFFVVTMIAMAMALVIALIFVIAGAFGTVAMLGGLLPNFHYGPLLEKILITPLGGIFLS
jgi:hypothetical protein